MKVIRSWLGPLLCSLRRIDLRTFARNFSNIDFSRKILSLKDDELVMSEM